MTVSRPTTIQKFAQGSGPFECMHISLILLCAMGGSNTRNTALSMACQGRKSLTFWTSSAKLQNHLFFLLKCYHLTRHMETKSDSLESEGGKMMLLMLKAAKKRWCALRRQRDNELYLCQQMLSGSTGQTTFRSMSHLSHK